MHALIINTQLSAAMNPLAAEAALDTYKAVRRRFFEAGEGVLGPGVMSMAEYYFIRKNGRNPFAMLFSAPKAVYDEWVLMFKGERAVLRVLEEAAGPGYLPLLDGIKRNDAPSVWSMLHKMAAVGRAAAA